MKVLVSGGTGLIGRSTVRALRQRGNAVRVLSRRVAGSEGIESWIGDVSRAETIRGAAEGCCVVVHIAGIAGENPPARTFRAVNINGTRNVVLEAQRAGVQRIVFVSSLGAERGQSAYHRSKHAAEDEVRGFSGDWVVVRPGAVYGPGDENISMLFRMVRSLPVVPTIGDGRQKFQPIWHEDLADALAMAVERDDVRCRVLEIAGAEITSQNDLTARMRTLTERAAFQAPLPERVAAWGLRALGALGVDVPFGEAQLRMLTEGNFIRPGHSNALTDVFGLAATPLDVGLRRLACEEREQLPASGVGPLTRKRFWVDIERCRHDADGLFAYVCDHLAELLPPAVRIKSRSRDGARVEQGETLTMEIPMRGQVQVRVAEVAGRHMTLLTLAGHPIAGVVRFVVEARGDAVRFEITVYDRAATVFDEVMLRTVGDWVQRSAWIGLAENVARASGNPSARVRSSEETLDDRELHAISEWAKALCAS